MVVDLNRLPSRRFIELVRSKTGASNPVGLIGGPPCQGVSQGNRDSGPQDLRNSLMTTFLRLAEASEAEFGIDFFVFENVPGLLQAKNSARLKALKAGLGRKFHISLQKVNAQDFGVPQKRSRVLIIGLSKKKYIAADLPEISSHLVHRTVRQTIEGLPEATFFSRSIAREEIAYHPNHWTMQPKSPKFSATEPFKSGRSFRRLEWDEPSRTVAYGHREIHIHPKGHRRVSVLEAMLLQGFGEKYVLKGTLSSQIQQISNAVPPPLAKAVARELLSILQE